MARRKYSGLRGITGVQGKVMKTGSLQSKNVRSEELLSQKQDRARATASCLAERAVKSSRNK
ncbi:hypothetical protein J6590_051249 [Homalodisca vitripennis]|nr:hypothetical protein J6590_051249 [Homalodisca vitripennis]